MSLDGQQIFGPELFAFFQELIVKGYGFPIQASVVSIICFSGQKSRIFHVLILYPVFMASLSAVRYRLISSLAKKSLKHC